MINFIQHNILYYIPTDKHIKHIIDVNGLNGVD